MNETPEQERARAEQAKRLQIEAEHVTCLTTIISLLLPPLLLALSSLR